MATNNKLREALDALQCIDTRGLKRLLFELVEADIFDHGQINKTISAVDRAKAALAAPARNCDRFKTKEEAALAYAEECNAFIPQSILWQIGEWLDWLFYETKKDGAE